VFYAFLLGVAALGSLVYLFIAGMYPGLKEERFGVLEPLPSNLGKWEADSESESGRAAAADGKKLEVRFLFEEGGLFSSGKLLRQSRLRDATSNEILTVLPDEPIKRKRIRQIVS
jgi:hypothetical protein